MQRLVYREITYVPGLYKIVDEILVNAVNNKVRNDKMNLIKDEKVTTHLFAASNYDDEEKKVSGGRNGFGTKLANLYSIEFILEQFQMAKNIAKLYDLLKCGIIEHILDEVNYKLNKELKKTDGKKVQE
ncbi:1995_t:CDS:2, partial [Funneliformis mosseae]